MSDRFPLTYVVVITYNGRRFLEPCFSTMLQTDYANVRFLLVDNASTENLAAYVEERFPQVETLRLNSNVGSAGAANAGIEYAIERAATYVVVCNDDIVVLDPLWLDQAVRQMQRDPRLGIVGFQEVRRREDVPVTGHVRLTSAQYPRAFALLVRASLLKNLGAYDAIYQTGSDDDDLAARALKAGYRVGELNIPFVHYGGGTHARYVPRAGYLHMRNSLRFSVKHRGPLHWLLRIVRMLDVACNPWPFTFDPKDLGHQRWRNRGNVLVNAWLCFRAITWNIVRLPQTLHIRVRESRLIRQARQRLQQASRAAQPIDCGATHANRGDLSRF